MENKAAFLTAPKTPLLVQSAPLIQPEENEVLIRNHALAINRVDYKQQETGKLVKEYPHIMGHDIAGVVVEVGPNVTSIKKGDRVAALAPALGTGKQEHAGFQLYTVIPLTVVSIIPDNIPFTDAAVLPTGLATATFGLFESCFLGIEPPNISAPAPLQNSNKAILIWGGSSSVGSCAIQQYAAAGFTILTTASPKNFEYVQDLGATHVFDHSDPSTVKKLVDATQGKEILGAYDTVSSDATTLACAEFLEKLGGGKVFCTLYTVAGPEMPNGVSRLAGHPPYRAPDGGSALWQRVWANFFNQGLENGRMRAKPDSILLKGGLEKLQEGIDLYGKGVSAKKIVVQLRDD